MELQEAIPVVEKLRDQVKHKQGVFGAMSEAIEAILDRPTTFQKSDAIALLSQMVYQNSNPRSLMHQRLSQDESQALTVVMAHALRKEGQQ